MSNEVIKKCPLCSKEFSNGEMFCSFCGGSLYVPKGSVSPMQPVQSAQSTESTQNTHLTQPIQESNCTPSFQQSQPIEIEQNGVPMQSTQSIYTVPNIPTKTPVKKMKKKLPKWAYIVIGGFGFFIFLLIVISSICIHEWNSATCLAPETCDICGETRGDVIEHEWKEATCSTPKTCSLCGTSEGEALGHSVEKWNLLSKSTCSVKGKTMGKCTVCKETVIKELDLLPHTEGKWEVTKSATKDAKGEQSIKCTVCKSVIKTKEYELSPKEIEKEYKSKCAKYSYDKIARSPDQYKGKQAKIYGKVVQVMQQKIAGKIFYTLRVGTGGSYYYDNVVYVVYTADESEPRILEDDMITVYGELKGEYTYETVMGNEITIPYMSGEYID